MALLANADFACSRSTVLCQLFFFRLQFHIEVLNLFLQCLKLRTAFAHGIDADVVFSSGENRLDFGSAPQQVSLRAQGPSHSPVRCHVCSGFDVV